MISFPVDPGMMGAAADGLGGLLGGGGGNNVDVSTSVAQSQNLVFNPNIQVGSRGAYNPSSSLTGKPSASTTTQRNQIPASLPLAANPVYSGVDIVPDTTAPVSEQSGGMSTTAVGIGIALLAGIAWFIMK